jgi:hypothetical protein
MSVLKAGVSGKNRKEDILMSMEKDLTNRDK